jgi:superkiller protein 3
MAKETRQLLQWVSLLVLMYLILGCASTEERESREAMSPVSKGAAKHYNKAADLINKHKYQAAVTHLQLALQDSPQFVEAYYPLGFAQAKLGNYDEAIAALNKALELKPDYKEVKDILPTVYAQKGSDLRNKKEFDEAIKCFQKALELNPQNAQIYYALGVTYADKRDIEKAVQSLNQAIQLNPKGPIAEQARKALELIQQQGK